MDYQKMKQLLITEFNKNDYQVLVKQNKRNSRSVKLTELSNQSAFLAYYPGYKAKVNSRGIYYDYRVDLQKEGNQVVSIP